MRRKKPNPLLIMAFGVVIFCIVLRLWLYVGFFFALVFAIKAAQKIR